MLGISRFNNTATTQQQRNTTQPQRSALQSQPCDSFTSSKRQQPNFKGYVAQLNTSLRKVLWGEFERLGLRGASHITENGCCKEVIPDRFGSKELSDGRTLVAAQDEVARNCYYSAHPVMDEENRVNGLLREAFKAVGIEPETMQWPRQGQ